jgi:hypothetical protein
VWSEGKRLWVIVGVITLISGCFVWPILSSPSAISTNDDWTQIFAFQAYLEDQITMHLSLPMRSHMLGGGFPIIGHPEYPIFSPLTLTVLAFGAVLGTKINVLLVYGLGLFGMWRLCRRTYDLNPHASAYATLVFALAGWFPAIIDSGNYPEIYFMWMPLLAYLLLDVRRFDGRLFDGRLVIATLIAATMLTDGHLNSVCCFLILALWAALRSANNFLRVALFAVCTAGVAAFKLLPTIALLMVEDRSIDIYSSVTIETATFNWEAFLGPVGRVDSFALGPVPWVMAAVGVAVWRKTWRLGVLFLVSLLLWLGPNAPIDIFYLLTRIPVFSSIDAPSKYFVFFLGFTVILMGAVALDALPEWAYPKLTTSAMALVAAGLLFLPGWHRLGQVFDKADFPQEARAFVQVDTPYFVEHVWEGPEDQKPDLYRYYRKGLGIVRWEDNFQLPSKVKAHWLVQANGTLAENPHYQGEAWLPAGQGRATLSKITANSIVVDIQASSDSTLTINQNYDPNWRCSSGEVEGDDGLLAVPVKSGVSQVSCHYQSPVFRVGFGLSIVSLILLLLAWRRFGRESSA